MVPARTLPPVVPVLLLVIVLQLLLLQSCEAGWQSGPAGFRMLAQRILKQNKKKIFPSWPKYSVYGKRADELLDSELNGFEDDSNLAEDEYEPRETRGFGNAPLPMQLSRYRYRYRHRSRRNTDVENNDNVGLL